jgi:hypothetical protein
MTNTFLATFDADAHAAFLDAGMADVGVLRQTVEGVPVDVDCQVFVDREPLVTSAGGVDMLSNTVGIRILRAGISRSPRARDTITIMVDDVPTEVFIIGRIERTDESSWEVSCPA